jgi:hypothetical protein
MEEAGESRGGRGSYIDKTWNRQTPLPDPVLHYCQVVPRDCASGSVSGAKLSKTMRHLSITREGEGAGAMMSSPLINSGNQTAVPFQFPFIVLLHG